MATITAMLKDDYVDKDGLCPIIIRIAHDGKRRRIPVSYKVQEKFWAAGKVSNKHPEAALINAAISTTFQICFGFWQRKWQ